MHKSILGSKIVSGSKVPVPLYPISPITPSVLLAARAASRMIVGIGLGVAVIPRIVIERPVNDANGKFHDFMHEN